MPEDTRGVSQTIYSYSPVQFRTKLVKVSAATVGYQLDPVLGENAEIKKKLLKSWSRVSMDSEPATCEVRCRAPGTSTHPDSGLVVLRATEFNLGHPDTKGRSPAYGDLVSPLTRCASVSFHHPAAEVAL